MTTMIQRARPAASDFRDDKTKAHRCKACGRACHLRVRDPLPDGWLVRVYGLNGQRTDYWCSRECREGAG